ncbi:hypothetical protein [Cohaesibacter sp. ES.047]|uniref:hypothetical protein n=1 Tax=Cohaesibacter sp. ES.047 TaxID=1798205 RepID=UPI0012FD946C|nr:hypothetical protein [Cohaesibacter sp. ES.047]
MHGLARFAARKFLFFNAKGLVWSVNAGACLLAALAMRIDADENSVNYTFCSKLCAKILQIFHFGLSTDRKKSSVEREMVTLRFPVVS